MTRQTTLTNTRCCETYSELWHSYSWRPLLKFCSRKSCCLSALRAHTVTVFYSACICCVVWCLIGMIFKNTTQLTEASLASSCWHITSEQGDLATPWGLLKQWVEGVKNSARQLTRRLPRQVAPWINYKKSGHYSQIWSLHFNDFCCVFCWPTQCSTTKSV